MSKAMRDDEEQLIARSQNGDVNAFNQLVLHYQQLLYSVVFRMLGDPDVAADVTQDAFIAAFKGIGTYRGGASFRSWLLRVGSNMACDYWRRTRRRAAESLEALTDEEAHSPDSLQALMATGLEDNPEEMVLNQELQALIQHGLEELPLEQRVAVVLCDVEGLSYEEVAAATDVSIGTVRSRISRGRTRLRAFLQEHKELLPGRYRLTKE